VSDIIFLGATDIRICDLFSVCLDCQKKTLSEGSAKPSTKERLRFYNIAFGSLREVQAIIRLEELNGLYPRADHLAAML
jgi:hypothetical protein